MTTYSYEQLCIDFHSSFGSKKFLDVAWLKKLQHNGWMGMTCLSMRALSWRVMLGVLLPDLTKWPKEMESHHFDYEELKATHLPDLNRVQADPLSGVTTGQEEGGEWERYYSVRFRTVINVLVYISSTIFNDNLICHI